MSLSSAGHRFALTRVASDLTAHGAAKEYSSGLEYARWLKKMSSARDGELRSLLEELAALARRLVTRERMTISVNETVDRQALTGLLEAVPCSGEPAPGPAAYPLPGSRREGMTISSAVGFAAMGDNLKLHGRAYHGSFAVLANVLNYTYLWSEIRVQGGAYGCGFGCRNSGDLFYYTYRDPQPVRSLEVMEKAPAYLRAFCGEEPDLTGFILGAVSALDPLRGEGARMTAAENRWFRGVGEEEIRRLYAQLIHTTPQDLLALVPALEELAAERALCVTAGAPLLEACGSGLDELLTV